jgi:hypothetical protein
MTRWCARSPLLAVLLVIVASSGASAQEPPPPDSVARDSVRRAPVVPALPPMDDSLTQIVRRRAPLMRAPLSPRRAFLMSFLIPGLAQAKLDRTTSGALFAAVEMGSFAMLRKSQADVAEVRRQGTDSIPGNFTVDPSTGAVTPGATLPARFDETLESTRRLHVEDWIAALAFNHLISAADAFVSAQLWDVPTRVTVFPTTTGWTLAASVRW